MDAIVYDKVGKEAEKVREALYGIYPQETITDAAIASFDDGADGIPVKALTVGVEPVQDLHGYSSPWPAGGNVNLLPTAQSKTLNGITFAVQSDGSINISGTATAASSIDIGRREFTLPAGTYRYEYNAGTISGVSTSVWADGSPASLLLTGTGVFTTAEEINPFVRIAVASGTTVNFTARPMISAGSDAYAYSPYSNICPISGNTGAEIEQAGKNILPNKVYDGRSGYLYLGQDTNATDCPFYLKAGEYTFNSNNSVNANLYFKPLDGASTKVTPSGAQNINVTFTIPSDGWYQFYLYASGITSADVTWFQLELGSTATDYEPYIGNQILVTFPETIYGGEDEVTTGKLINRIKKIVAKNMTWLKHTSGVFYALVLDKENINANRLWCDTFKVHDGNATSVSNAAVTLSSFECIASKRSQNPYIYVLTPDETVEAFLENYGDTEIIYELAEPTEYTLTPQTLPTLHGTNNIWANTGNIEKLTYRADLGKYIDSHITTAVANALNA